MKVEPKEIYFGNTRILIHSKLAHMTAKEQRDFYENAKKNGHPDIERITRTMYEIQKP